MDGIKVSRPALVMQNEYYRAIERERQKKNLVRGILIGIMLLVAFGITGTLDRAVYTQTHINNVSN